MSTDKMIAIAEKLLERSRQGQLKWSDTADERMFTVGFPDSSVVIAKPIRTLYELSVHNQLGTEVESMGARAGEEGHVILE